MNLHPFKLHRVYLDLPCEQALQSALAAGREKEGELATTSLEFEYLHRKNRSEMLIGGDDNSNDVITLGTCFQCLFTFALVSVSRWLAEIWQFSRRRATRELEVELKFHRRSCKLPSFSRPSARASRRACSQANLCPLNLSNIGELSWSWILSILSWFKTRKDLWSLF